MDNVIHIGYVFRDVIEIIGIDYELKMNNSNTALIANVEAKIIDEKTSRIIEIIRGQAWLIDCENYDVVVFAGLRAMFGLDFPRLGIVNFEMTDYVMVKRFGDRELQESDYWPHTKENNHFRFNIALIVYFCKLVGCPLHLKDIRVLNGVPYFWKGKNLGYRNTTTVSDDEFIKIFGVDLNSSTLRKGKGNYMTRAVIEYFREIDFDTDILRAILYVKDAEVRFRKGLRTKYQLARKPKVIEELIEENYSLLIGPYPYNIFNSYVGRPKHTYLYHIANNKPK